MIGTHYTHNKSIEITCHNILASYVYLMYHDQCHHTSLISKADHQLQQCSHQCSNHTVMLSQPCWWHL